MNQSNDDFKHPLAAGEHEIFIDGVRQVYHVAGNGQVCLVHSGGPGFHWKYLKMPELEKTMTMVYLEPVGTGKSDMLPDGDYSMPRYAHFAHKVAEHIGAQKYYFLGHAHGGGVGLQYALDYPNELGGLILQSSAPSMGLDLYMEQFTQIENYAQRWPDHAEAQDAKQAMMDSKNVRDKESALAVLHRLLPAYFGNYWNIKEKVDKWRVALDFFGDPNRQPYEWDVRDILNTITTPTLILVGEYDVNCGPRFSYELAEKIPDSHLVVFERGGHMEHVEHTEQFTQAVNEFIAQRN
ncbi:proline iminopeptidase [Paenibacillus endophyticus]|uniref:Proline iminopeptidase n=1 Tax=Paenibacillus endophyticus TaxID=1294268 RepID=A0A7W5GDE6_9BACL|nr:alpha/beta hydrolase [Paenibacillus endophyticus]MBB3155845.1 proline iminopeptidase [Paenibacillus endophyticus]